MTVVSISSIDGVYRYLCDCAQAGKIAGRTSDIGQAVGMTQPTVSGALGRLVKQGRISRDRQGKNTRFVITATSSATGWMPVRGRVGPVTAAQTKRNCMCCRQLFSSQGIHNRLCSNCGKQSEGA